MAVKPETRACWGIDIGNAGLKALRLKYVESAEQVMAVAFDFVPHPKILTQPDANPEELIAQALDTFLSRNPVKGDVLAISVPGEHSLAKFIQLPPVESRRVAEIVKYEARQQIPFSLDEVIWDFQPLGSGVEAEGFLIDAEVGLFAMKKEHVRNYLNPYLKRKVEIDLIQIAPMALYNYMCHDLMGQKSSEEGVEEEEHTIVLDMGADNTTLMVTNGKKIWLRNVPMGGNHFTRALTKEMKLTFAKAEHLKCNATKAPDPKAIFQALRPVFNDYAGEIQRSIGFFSSVNRNAKIKKIVGLGGGFKLAGLQKFLQQNLQMEVERAETFEALAGDGVLNAPLFQENLPSFGVCYGLALQGLKVTRVKTSLLPKEITAARMVRAKKPWAVAAAATVLLGLGLANMVDARGEGSVSTARFGAAEQKVKEVTGQVGSQKTAYDAAVAKNAAAKKVGEELLAHAQGRTSWLDVYRAINECLPRDSGEQKAEEDPSKKNQVRLISVTCERVGDLKTWFDSIGEKDRDAGFMDDRDKAAPPSGPGYVFTLSGEHYHHEEHDPKMRGGPYVAGFFQKNFLQWTLQQPGTATPVPVRKIGISHPYVASYKEEKRTFVPKGKRVGNWNANVAGSAVAPGTEATAGASALPMLPPAAAGVPGVPGVPAGGAPAAAPAGKGAPGAKSEDRQELRQTKFILKFAWRDLPAPLTEDPWAAAAAAAPGTTDPAAAPGAVPGQTPPTGTPPVAAAGTPTPGGPMGTPTAPGVLPMGAANPTGVPAAPGTP